MEEEKKTEKWTKAGIKEVLDDNKKNLAVATAGAALLAGLGLTTPMIGELQGIDPAYIAMAEKVVLVEMAVGLPLFVKKVFRITKRKKILTELNEEMERTGQDEIEIEGTVEDRIKQL